MFRTLTLAAALTTVTSAAFAGGISSEEFFAQHLAEGNSNDRVLAEFVNNGDDTAAATKSAAFIQHLEEGDSADRALANYIATNVSTGVAITKNADGANAILIQHLEEGDSADRALARFLKN